VTALKTDLTSEGEENTETWPLLRPAPNHHTSTRGKRGGGGLHRTDWIDKYGEIVDPKKEAQQKGRW